MQQCNYTTDFIFNLHMGCLSVHRGRRGKGHSLPPDTKDFIFNLHMGCLSVHRGRRGKGHSLPPDTNDSTQF